MNATVAHAHPDQRASQRFTRRVSQAAERKRRTGQFIRRARPPTQAA